MLAALVVRLESHRLALAAEDFRNRWARSGAQQQILLWHTLALCFVIGAVDNAVAPQFLVDAFARRGTKALTFRAATAVTRAVRIQDLGSSLERTQKVSFLARWAGYWQTVGTPSKLTLALLARPRLQDSSHLLAKPYREVLPVPDARTVCLVDATDPVAGKAHGTAFAAGRRVLAGHFGAVDGGQLGRSNQGFALTACPALDAYFVVEAGPGVLLVVEAAETVLQVARDPLASGSVVGVGGVLSALNSHGLPAHAGLVDDAPNVLDVSLGIQSWVRGADPGSVRHARLRRRGDDYEELVFDMFTWPQLTASGVLLPVAHKELGVEVQLSRTPFVMRLVVGAVIEHAAVHRVREQAVRFGALEAGHH
ncbi:unnamed protein product [Ixodes pacificus]